MPRKKTSPSSNSSTSYAAKKMKRRKAINLDHLKVVEPLTPNQETVFEDYSKGKNLVLHGAAGTGKTFVSLYLAMQSVMDLKSKYERVIIVRSLIPTREIGFLPGDEEDKSALYQVPYQNMVQFMFEMQNEQQFNQTTNSSAQLQQALA